MPASRDSEPNSNDPVRESVRFILDTVAELKERTRDIEKRMRSMEKEDLDQIRNSVYKLENHVSNFKSTTDSHKERWSMALNFIVQLVWVIMASYVLTKLGIGMGPV
jgi:hypothetical protein